MSDFDSITQHCAAASPQPKQPKQPQAQGQRQRGKIKFFDSRGFGFIRALGSEAFYHAKTLSPDYKSPNRGDLVEFSIVPGKDGRARAANVHLLERAPRHGGIE
jgi:cold shock CspA family protein